MRLPGNIDLVPLELDETRLDLFSQVFFPVEKDAELFLVLLKNPDRDIFNKTGLYGKDEKWFLNRQQPETLKKIENKRDYYFLLMLEPVPNEVLNYLVSFFCNCNGEQGLVF